jgi:hypothetical protein
MSTNRFGTTGTAARCQHKHDEFDLLMDKAMKPYAHPARTDQGADALSAIRGSHDE